MKKLYYLTVFVILFCSFSGDINMGNRVQSPIYDLNQIKGVFVIYDLRVDYFGNQTYEKRTHQAKIFASAGDTASRVNVGTITYNNEPLSYEGNEYQDTIIASINGNNKWEIDLIGTNQNFKYKYLRGIAQMAPLQFPHDTVFVQNGLLLDVSDHNNADSVIVIIADFIGNKIERRRSGICDTVFFSANELEILGNGGYISIAALNIEPDWVNNEFYLFSSLSQRMKIFYFKH